MGAPLVPNRARKRRWNCWLGRWTSTNRLPGPRPTSPTKSPLSRTRPPLWWAALKANRLFSLASLSSQALA